MQFHRLAWSYISLHAVPWAYMQVHELTWSSMVPNCGTFWQIFTPLCIFSGFHCFHFQYELFWPFPFKPPQLLPCRIQSRRPKFWTKFWTKFPQTSFTVNQVMNEVLNWQKKLAVYYQYSNYTAADRGRGCKKSKFGSSHKIILYSMRT